MQGYSPGGRDHLVQQLQLLGPQLEREGNDAGEIAARTIEASHKAGRDRVDAGHEHDRDGRGRCLGRERRRRTAGSGDHANLPAKQVRRQRGRSVPRPSDIQSPLRLST
jgi:hypothetical protein